MGLPFNDEHQIISELKQGSERALRRIYDLYGGRLMAFALQYCHSRETAEEITEDTCLWVWNHRQDIRQETTLKGLLFIKARHLLINAYRATVNNPQFEDYVAWAEAMADSATPTARMEYDDFVQKVSVAMQKLPKTQQRVIQMSRFELIPIRDIASSLNLTEQTTRNQLSLGLKRLRLLLATSGAGWVCTLILC